MATTEKILFVNTDADAVVTALVGKYEALTGKRMQPGQIEQLEFNAVGYRISLLLNAINETANQCLVAFATGAALEQLGLLMGVFRLPASAAQTVIRFTMVPDHGPLTIEAGLRVQSIDGKVVFTTTEQKTVLDTDAYVDIPATCTQFGIVGNGYIANRLVILLDPRPYIASVNNISTTNGGGDNETDAAMRERILLAPSQFSVAGPTGAYKYWAKSAHPSIVDVAVTIGHEVTDTSIVIPGQVDIFPLLVNNATPTTEITDAIYAICNDEKIRPLTDTVVIKAPTKIDYQISAQLTILPDALSADVIAKVTTNINAYVNERKNKLGIDAVRNQIIAICKVDGVYDIVLPLPSTNIVVAENGFTNCVSISVVVTGTHDE